ncbi:MAG: RNA methyltransferase [Verrucomicrobia bacterium]|nr:RNA methyltransferase [Verrucomicrobiota bacterium]
MVEIEEIRSFEDPRLLPYRTMRRQDDHEAQGVFVAEGDKVVARLLETAITVISMLVQRERVEEYRRLLSMRPERVWLHAAEKAVLEQLTGYPLYQGVLALAKIPFQPRSISFPVAPGGLVVALDGLANAENLGVIARNAAAFGADVLLVGENCVSPYLRRAVRNSMGALFRMRLVLSFDLAADLRRLDTLGFRNLAAHPHTDRRVLAQAGMTGHLCVVFGSEGHGIRPEVLAECGEWVAAPMAPGVDSLNVASASAVFLYEACRQRSARAGRDAGV